MPRVGGFNAVTLARGLGGRIGRVGHLAADSLVLQALFVPLCVALKSRYCLVARQFRFVGRVQVCSGATQPPPGVCPLAAACGRAVGSPASIKSDMQISILWFSFCLLPAGSLPRQCCGGFARALVPPATLGIP